jgi:OmcA/MtrC family decaheme c-type cytochrome
VAGIEKPLESCAVCHGTNSLAEVTEVHALPAEVDVTNVVPAVVDDDLTFTFNVTADGVALTDLNAIVLGRDGSQSAYRFDGTLQDVLSTDGDDVGPDVATPATLAGGTGGNYTLTIEGGAIYANANNRYLVRIQNPAGTRAMVVADYPASPHNDVVDSGACANCHGLNANGRWIHGSGYDYPLKAENCTVCHNAENSAGENVPYVMVGHSIHNSHNMPGGEFELVLGNRTYNWETTYPTYMTNCSVCHGTGEGLAAANAMPPSYTGCTSCHGSMESFGFEAGSFHLNIVDDSLPCTTCHVAPVLPATVADFHNGLETERVGIIWDGVDTSVEEGKRFAWQIDSIVDDGTNLKISWSVTYDNVAVDPCNATVAEGAPGFFAAPSWDGSMGMLRSYVQGDDYVLGKGAAPGQANTTNLSTTNTVCDGTVATTTIAVDADVPAGTRGVVAMVGKPTVLLPPGFADSLHAADWADPVTGEQYTYMYVRVPTPVEEWIVGSSGIVAKEDQRRGIADTGACLKCHVGSLYQHGNTRVDNVTMCVICHNSASSEQNNRNLMGVDATEAYDGKVGQTYEFKSMLHALHSVDNGLLNPAKKPFVIYRTRGIYAWAPEGVTPPNWPATSDPTLVFGGDPAVPEATQAHNLHHPTYPRAANDCAACHKAGFGTMVDQTKGVATTLDAGVCEANCGTRSAVWRGQLDDTLQGANTAACTSCHKDAPSTGHANANGWVPTVFPNGRQTIIDAAK